MGSGEAVPAAGLGASWAQQPPAACGRPSSPAASWALPVPSSPSTSVSCQWRASPARVWRRIVTVTGAEPSSTR